MLTVSQKVEKHPFPSFRRTPESRFFEHLHNAWTPVFTGVTTFYEAINIGMMEEWNGS